MSIKKFERKAAPKELKGGLNPELPRLKIPAWQRPLVKTPPDASMSPKARRARSENGDLDGKPIEMWFEVPLSDTQQKEIMEKLRPLLSHGKRRISVTSGAIKVEGLLVRESKPVRDELIRFRDSVCPRRIRLRKRGSEAE